MKDRVTKEIASELEDLSEGELRLVLRYVKTFKSQTPRGVDWEKLMSVVGTIPSEDLEEMRQAIEEHCERIDESSW